MTTAQVFRKMMEEQDKILIAVRAQFPEATEVEIYQRTKGAMDYVISYRRKQKWEN